MAAATGTEGYALVHHPEASRRAAEHDTRSTSSKVLLRRRDESTRDFEQGRADGLIGHDQGDGHDAPRA
jgi:hypothetical protein